MIEQFEYIGVWWLPTEPDTTIPGVLRFDPQKGSYLELIGSFTKPIGMGWMQRFEIVLGVTSDGKNITLWGGRESQSKYNSRGFSRMSLFIHMVLIGAHFEKVEDLIFDRVSIRYAHLDEWADISGFSITRDESSNEVSVQHKMPDKLEIFSNDEYKLFIATMVHGPGWTRVQKEAHIIQETYFTIIPMTKHSLNSCLEILYRLRELLSLAIFRPAHVLDIQAKVGDLRVKIIYRQFDIPEKSKILHDWDMLFTLNDIREQSQIFIHNWLTKAEVLTPIYSLYFGALYNPRIYLEHEFLSYAQAIESYHRRTTQNFELPPNEHAQRIEAIVNSVPEEHRKWLSQKLNYSNEPNLRTRLKEIFAMNEQIFAIFLDKKAAKHFVAKVVTTRNYLTHYSQENADQAASGDDLAQLNLLMKIVIEVCLLRELGFSLEVIQGLLSRNRLYQRRLGL